MRDFTGPAAPARARSRRRRGRRPLVQRFDRHDSRGRGRGAANSFPPRTVLHIVGGSDKGLPFTALAAALCERAKAVLCIGTTGPTIDR